MSTAQNAMQQQQQERLKDCFKDPSLIPHLLHNSVGCETLFDSEAKSSLQKILMLSLTQLVQITVGLAPIRPGPTPTSLPQKIVDVEDVETAFRLRFPWMERESTAPVPPQPTPDHLDRMNMYARWRKSRNGAGPPL
jgi:hypothetical protein